RIRIGDDAAPGAQLNPVTQHTQRADQDIHVHGAIAAEESERPGVCAPAAAFQLCNDLHATELRHSRDRAARKHRSQGADGCYIRAQLAADIRYDVMYMRVRLDGHELINAHGAWLADPAEVIALEVDQHDVLRGLL